MFLLVNCNDSGVKDLSGFFFKKKLKYDDLCQEYLTSRVIFEDIEN